MAFCRCVWSKFDSKRPLVWSFKTQTGADINVERDTKETYQVKIEAVDNHKPSKDKACKDYTGDETYADCVDEQLKKTMLPKLGCMPPWLSHDNQCLGIYTGSNYTRFNSILNDKDFTKRLIEPMLYMEKFPIQSQCMQPCVTTNNFVDLKLREFLFSEATVIIKFEEDVSLTKTITTYHLSDFAVDVGSLLGFWLGLSVFGLTEVLENLVKFARDMFKKQF